MENIKPMKKILFFTFLLLSHQLFAQFNQFYLFVGTFTTGKSEGIYVYEFNTKSGDFKYRSVFKGLTDPSFLAISPDKKFVYSAGENSPQEATIHALSFNQSLATLSLVNTQVTNGERACHVAIDKTGKWVFVSNYRSGNLSVFPVEIDGKLGKATQTIQHEGKSIDPERQEKAHAHSVNIAENNIDVFVNDLGIDKIMTYKFDALTGRLSPANPAFTKIEDGSGPRHFDFHPNGKFAYSINELSSTITGFNYENGSLKAFQTISTLPQGYTGRKWSADIHISPDGDFLYASNRTADNIAIFSINNKTGQLTLVGFEPTGGKTPRNFIIAPHGNFLLVANQESDDIIVFSRDKKTGKLLKVSTINVPSPVCLKMMPK
jgi:6-phosphogluconolactonase